MTAVAEPLDSLMRRHDDDPAGVAQGLRQHAVLGVAAADQQCYGWLVNHVVGELLGDWPQALSLQLQAIAEPALPAGWRNRAVAACFAGQPLIAWEAEWQLAEHGAVEVSVAALAVRLGVLQHAPLSEATITAFAQSLSQLAIQTEQLSAHSLCAMMATGFNNTTSRLLESCTLQTTDATQRQALRAGAEAARRLWRGAGNWLNHERADYLCAMTYNALGEYRTALDPATSGIATIAAHGPEDVDLAFLQLERSHACRGLGQCDEASDALYAAKALASQFDDPGLQGWFAERLRLVR